MEITPTVGARLFWSRPRGTSGQADCSLLAMRARAPRRCLLWWALEKVLHINIQKKCAVGGFNFVVSFDLKEPIWGWWSYSSIIVFEGETTNLSSLIQPPTGNYCLRDMKHASWINCTIFNPQLSVNQPLVDHRKTPFINHYHQYHSHEPLINNWQSLNSTRFISSSSLNKSYPVQS